MSIAEQQKVKELEKRLAVLEARIVRMEIAFVNGVDQQLRDSAALASAPLARPKLTLPLRGRA